MSETYHEYLKSLLPVGPAWPRDNDSVMTIVLKPLAEELSDVEERIASLIAESDPRTVLEMLTDWEREFGLPDSCNPEGLTLQERKAALIQKVYGTGGQSIAYFKSLADMLGYFDVEIKEFRPFIAGKNRCGDFLGGAHTIRHYWRVAIPNARVTYFRTGASRCGEKLGIIARAADLECIFNRYKPAHTVLIFSYQGA